jgi:hypothetical protein
MLGAPRMAIAFCRARGGGRAWRANNARATAARQRIRCQLGGHRNLCNAVRCRAPSLTPVEDRQRIHQQEWDRDVWNQKN